MSTTAQELDARGLNCPLPILRAKKALNGLQQGEVLNIRATDPGSVKDFDPKEVEQAWLSRKEILVNDFSDFMDKLLFDFKVPSV